ncbi:hypothetical protein B566_EDAN001969 [Ephemera danica]|nr:hypothetical protein B566_EDAN001969 [Ephemera danica]
MRWCFFLFLGVLQIQAQTLRVYWNVPTSSCKQFGIHFNLSQYEIIQNKNDEFIGEKIGILYNPGQFPLYNLNSDGAYMPVNGGIPQRGNMTVHFTELKKLIDQKFPDPNFSGRSVFVNMRWCFFLFLGVLQIQAQTLRVYWNVPTSSCKQFGIHFNLSQYEIIQNKNDEFIGEKIGILYNPGQFPLYNLNSDGAYMPVNGGIPQRGNMTVHFTELKKLIDQKFPDPNFSGVAVLDMESWRPLWRQMFASNPNQNIYRTESIAYERELHPCWSREKQEQEAEKRYELFAREFLERSINCAKQLRPHASWGYYIYPSCFNYSPEHNFDCPPSAKRDNDEMSWLFSASGSLFPSAYISTVDPEEHRDVIIWARMEEGRRVAEASRCGVTLHGPHVLPYIWFRYADNSTFLSKADLSASLRTALSLNLNGIVIWGSSSDTNSLDKCQNLSNYVAKTLGPFVHSAVTLSKGRNIRHPARSNCPTVTSAANLRPPAPNHARATNNPPIIDLCV